MTDTTALPAHAKPVNRSVRIKNFTCYLEVGTRLVGSQHVCLPRARTLGSILDAIDLIHPSGKARVTCTGAYGEGTVAVRTPGGWAAGFGTLIPGV